MMRSSAATLAVLLLAVLGTDCSSDESYYVEEVTHRAQLEFPCSTVKVDEIDHYTYIASGCGCRGVYECGLANGEHGPHGCLLAPPVRGMVCSTP